MNQKPVAFITGAAQGIGRATALRFASRGYDIALLDLLNDGLLAVEKEAAALGAETILHVGDLTDLEFAEKTITSTIAKWGRIDVLVNNAAWRELTTMRRISPQSWQRTLDICLTAPAFMSRWAAEHMEQQQRGVIINVSSIMADHAGGIGPAYVAAKGGLDSLTFELASLYGGSGIRVLAVRPGAIDTQLGADYTNPQGQSVEQPLREWSEDNIPMRRWAQPDEIAAMIVLLASDEASYISGTTIDIDGGWRKTHFPRSMQKLMDPDQF